MKRRNWLLLSVCAIGVMVFVLSRTVWGPPSKAGAAELPGQAVQADPSDDEPSDAQRRYISNQPRHWRYVMLKH